MEKGKFQNSMETINSNFKFTDIHFSEKDDKNNTRNKIAISRTNQSLIQNHLFSDSKEESKI